MDHQPRNRDRRAFGRRRSCIHAWVLVPGRPPAPGIVRNFSTSGALIELNEILDPPGQFKLRIDRTGEEITCDLRHRKGAMLGLKFVSEKVGAMLDRAFAQRLPKPERRIDLNSLAATPQDRLTLRELRDYLPVGSQ